MSITHCVYIYVYTFVILGILSLECSVFSNKLSMYSNLTNMMNEGKSYGTTWEGKILVEEEHWVFSITKLF